MKKLSQKEYKTLLSIQEEPFNTSLENVQENIYEILQDTRNVSKTIHTAILEEKKESTTRFQLISQDLEEIKDLLTKKKKEEKTILPLRDPATNTIFYDLMQSKKQKYEKQISYSRFRVAITLLWATGMRINELKTFTRKDIEYIQLHGELRILQPKVQKYRTMYFTKKALEYIQSIEKDIEYVFTFSQELGGEMRNDSWIAFLNQRLEKKTKKYSQNIKSHSFRVNYATSLLKHANIHEVAAIIGHKDVRTTMAYNRYIPKKKESLQYLERTLLEESPQKPP